MAGWRFLPCGMKGCAFHVLSYIPDELNRLFDVYELIKVNYVDKVIF